MRANKKVLKVWTDPFIDPFKFIVLFAFLAALQNLLAQMSGGTSPSISAKDAKYHIGEDMVVTGTISEIFVSSQTTNVYLYLDGQVKNAKFASVWPGTNGPPVNALEELIGTSPSISVRGRIITENHVPEIIVSSWSQISAVAAERPIIEIVDYGIYTGDQNRAAAEASTANGSGWRGQVGLKLQKQTTVIPAQIGIQFGFRYTDLRVANKDARLHCVWLHPEITDIASGKKLRRFDADDHLSPGDNSGVIMWRFAHPSELVPGKWTFQIYQGEEMLSEMKFEVQKSDEK